MKTRLSVVLCLFLFGCEAQDLKYTPSPEGYGCVYSFAAEVSPFRIRVKSANDEAISDATITFTGPNSASATLDLSDEVQTEEGLAQGFYTIPESLDLNLYTHVEVSKAGYQSVARALNPYPGDCMPPNMCLYGTFILEK